MFAWDCCGWDQLVEPYVPETQPFCLPSPLPEWPIGNGFAGNRIRLGELEVVKITEFETIWSLSNSRAKNSGVIFIKPVSLPDGFYSLGDTYRVIESRSHVYVLAARESSHEDEDDGTTSELPPLQKPLKYKLIWGSESQRDGSCFFWLPKPPEGYKSMGIVVTESPEEPSIDEVRCVREDLTEYCERFELVLNLNPKSAKSCFQMWNIRPYRRGINARGVSVGTFYCQTKETEEDVQTDIACLKNLDLSLHAMPNCNQIHALIKNYGPTMYFHPEESYFPSSVQWFFKNGALLYEDGVSGGESIKYGGSNLPDGGVNDGHYWIDLPVDDDDREFVKRGNMESAELYVHVKPAIGGTFTDIAMWVFCPFNGPSAIKVGGMSVQMTRLGQHVGDWEHFTLRVSNFTGELWQVFFSEHSGGRWVDASELEFLEDNKPVVYSSKHGHASYPHPGTYLQGSTKLGIGVRNDVAQSQFYIDSSTRYQLIAVDHLEEDTVEAPNWLQYMRKWGPTIVYNSRSEIDKFISSLPFYIRSSVENLIYSLPIEIYGEEGPTGPKEKDNWLGDEKP